MLLGTIKYRKIPFEIDKADFEKPYERSKYCEHQPIAIPKGMDIAYLALHYSHVHNLNWLQFNF